MDPKKSALFGMGAIILILIGCLTYLGEERATVASDQIASIPSPTTVKERFPARATWYGMVYEGRKTASGETFRACAYTCAHPVLPFGTVLLVGYAGRYVVVRVTDRMPAAADGMALDLSHGAFTCLADASVGVINVTCEVLP